MFPTSRQNYHRHHRHQNYTYDYNYLHETTLSPHPHPQPPLTLEDLPLPLAPPLTPADLPSCLLALNRRAAIVSASLAHLTAVVKPLETTKPEELTENQLQDIWEEGAGLGRAMEEFREQMEEVSGVVEELLVGRRGMGRKGVVGGSGGGVRRVRGVGRGLL